MVPLDDIGLGDHAIDTAGEEPGARDGGHGLRSGTGRSPKPDREVRATGPDIHAIGSGLGNDRFVPK